MGALALRGYYAILNVEPRALAAGDVEALATRARPLLEASPCCLQLRIKAGEGPAPRESQIVALGRRLVGLCREASVPFCMNDRLDLALAAGADVVHLGQEDLPLADAQSVLASLGRRLVIGVSTHSLDQARAAADGGADYIGFGPVFTTGSKERPDPVVGLAGLAAVIADVRVPVVAIGGITRARLPEVVAAGASAAAVIGDIDGAADRAAAAREVASAWRRI